MADADALIATHYRPWRVSASRSHLQLGPLTVTWYRWIDGDGRLDAWWCARTRVCLLGGALR